MKIVLLTRAFKNFGDFLIAQRGLAFLKSRIGSEDQILERPGNLPFKDDADCIVIPGGPSARNGIFPDLYPLSEQVIRDRVPIYFMGIGSKLAMNNLDRLTGRLDVPAQNFLKHCNLFAPVGVRDELTARLLNVHGVDASFNGCPGWYSERFLSGSLPRRESLKTVVLTTPASFELVPEFKKILDVCVGKFGRHNTAVSFNHGTSPTDLIAQSCIPYIRGRNIGVIDASGGLGACDEYDKFDLHIGYRVHTHIYFCSEGRPSVLIPEDSRAVGANEALRTPIIAGYEISPNILRLVRALKKFPAAWGAATRSGVVKTVQNILASDQSIFEIAKASSQAIEDRRKVMAAFIDGYVLKRSGG